MERFYKRLWCKHCNEWHLFYNKDNENYCEVCNEKYTDVLLSEIPITKLEEQRKRYKKQQMEYFTSLYDIYNSCPSPYSSFFSAMNESYKNIITESDAGQIDIDKEIKKEKEKEKQERIILRNNASLEIAKYKNIGRNDICICGSEKKYKKCCMEKIEKLCLTYNL